METGDGSDVFNRFHLSGEVIRQRLLNEGWLQIHLAPVVMGQLKSLLILIIKVKLVLSCLMKRLLCHHL